MMALRWLINVVMSLILANRRGTLPINEAEFTESVLEIFSYPDSTICSPWLGKEKNFQNEGSQKARKRYIEIGFYKYSISSDSYVINLLSRTCRMCARHSFFRIQRLL